MSAMKKTANADRARRLDIRELPGFDFLRPEDAEALRSVCREVRFPSGAEIMREGEGGDTMYLFLSGEVNVSRSLTLSVGRQGFRNAEKSFVKLVAGEASVFGEMSMLEDAPRAATVTASADCVLYEVSRADFQALCDRDPTLGLKLLRQIAVMMSRRVRKANDEVLKLSTALSIALSRM